MKILSLLYVLLMSATALSQHSAGIRGGALFSSFEHNSGADSQTNTGLEIGGLISFVLFKGLYIQPEITFLQKGGSLDFGVFINDNYLSVKSDYIEIAALTGYALELKRMSFFANIGVFNGYLLATPIDKNPFEKTILNQTEKNWDFGGLIGIGAGIKMGKGKILVESRYRHTSGEFRTTSYGQLAGDPEFGITLNNRGWGINLGYSVILGKK